MATSADSTRRLIRYLRAIGAAKRRRRLPRQQLPIALMADYWRGIESQILRPVREAFEVDVFTLVRRELEVSSVRTDGPADAAKAIRDVAERILGRVLRAGELERFVGRYATLVANYQRVQLGRQMSAALGIDLALTTPRALLEAFTAENVALIRSIPEQYARDVERVVLRSFRSGARWSEIAKELRGRYDVSKNRAKLIARDQVGKLYGEINRERQKAVGLNAYIWRTSQDERVRNSHSAREGERYLWSEPPSDGHPGEPIQCRCYAEPDLSAVTG